jgi:hypothetical protein
MPLWLQNLIVFLAVGGCLAYVVRQGVGTFFGKKSRVGSCCAKGCSSDAQAAKPQQGRGERIVFLPVEALSRKR